MDQNLLLTAERLKLGAELQRGRASHGAFVIKNIPSQVYLTVSQDQARVLDAFGEGATVPDVFNKLLRERRCLPLREFYELVIKAHEAGVLCKGPSRQPPRRALTWPGWAAGPGWLWFFGAVQLLAAVVLVWHAPLLVGSMQVLPLLGGVLATIIALSSGQLLAASILSGLGGDVYSRRPFDSLAFLHPRLDLRDARLLGPDEQALVALAAKLPLALVLLGCWYLAPAATPPAIAAWLLVWRPWGEGLARRLAVLLSRRPALDTDSGFLFHANRNPQPHWRPWWRRWDWRVCAIEFVWTVAWTALLSRIALGSFGLGFFDVLTADFAYWSMALTAVAVALLISTLVALGLRWRDSLRRAYLALRQRWATHRRRRREYTFPDTDAALLRLASTHPLLARLNPYDRAELVHAWRPVTYPAGHEIPSEEPGLHVGLILSGRVDAWRAKTTGRRVRALVLEEGDIFGLPSPLAFGGEEVALSFRAASPVSALCVPAEVFQRCVIDKLGVLFVYDLTYKFAFLRRLSLCAHWDAAAVARFSRLAQIAAYPDGETILRDGTEANWFHIVYDGIAQVRRGERLLSRLKAGDFFGEIGLLQNGTAVADVVAQGQVRCLQIDRASFLRFMTHNHHVALELERISSIRLGHPIFPLRAAPVGTSHPYTSNVRRAGANSFG